MSDKTVGEEVAVVGYQWLDTAHFRKKMPFECVSQQWKPLMTVTQHQRLIEEAKQGQRVLAMELEKAREELEVERMRLTACGVAALGYFDGCKDEYRSASLEDVVRVYAERDQLKAEVEQLKAHIVWLECEARVKP